MEPVTAVVMRRIRAQSAEETGDVVASEYPVTLVCRSRDASAAPAGTGVPQPGRARDVATLMCTPEHLDELALGFLYTGGLLSSPEEVEGTEVEAGADAGRVLVTLGPAAAARLDAWRAARRDWQAGRPVGTGCGYAALTGEAELPQVRGGLRVSVDEIMAYLGEMVRAPVHRETGATHAAVLARGGEILCLREDVGRHNAIDKVVGWWLAHCPAGWGSAAPGIPPAEGAAGGGEGLIVLTTGRLSSDVVLKAGRLGAQVLVSRAAPTSLGIRLSYLIGLTLVGFARPGHLNVYTFPERVVGAPD